MIFEVKGKPLGKQRPRVTVRNGYARAYTPEKTVNYETLIKYAFISQKGDLDYLKPFSIRLTICYEIPKSKSKKWKEQALNGEIYPETKPDIDNVLKIFMDALNGLAYKDDNQVVFCAAEKIYSEMPCVICEIKNI